MENFSKALIKPVLLVILLDVAFTLLGQPKEYWQDFTQLNEGSPLGVLTLSRSPWLFVLFMLGYIIFVYILLKKLPNFIGTTAALAFFLGHAMGSGSWINTVVSMIFPSLNLGTFHYWYVFIGYFIGISFITSFLINKSIKAEIP